MTPAITFSLALALGQVPEVAPPAPFKAAQFRQHAAYLASDELQGRRPGSEGSAKAADYIVREFREFRLSPLGDGGTFFQTFPWRRQQARNLIAVFPGEGKLAEEAILLNAHYDGLGVDPQRVEAKQDGIFNGADDDAAGVSALLLIAEALKANAADLPSPRRSVVFIAFDAHESGMLGSEHYLSHPRWALEKTSAAISFDGMGRPRGGKVFAGDVSCAPVLQQRLDALAGKCGLHVETRLSGIRRNDYVRFFEREIPAFMLFTGLHADYHQVTDEVEKLNCDGAARIAWLAYCLLVETIADPQPIAFRHVGPTYDLQLLLRILSRIGVFPNMGAQQGRYPEIASVRSGSPAEKAGLRAGDRVTALNGKTFERFEDALVLWGQLQLEDGLRLSLLRDGKKVELTLPAELFTARSGPPVRPVGDGLFEVTFTYQPNKPAEAVYLAGSFNHWKPTAHKMDGPDQQGRFTTRLKLKKGTYEYKFVLDGQTWQPDPENLLQTGFYRNSVLHVGAEP